MVSSISTPNLKRADLTWLVAQLQQANVLDELAEVRLRARSDDRGNNDVLFLAKAKLPTISGDVLDGSYLASWLSERSQLPIVEINPLKIEVEKVTTVMSAAFAQRHGILCVELSPTELVIAVSDPFDDSWVQDVQHAQRREVKRVLGDVFAIAKYTQDFYALLKSVVGANVQTTQGKSSGLRSFEQLVDLNALGSPDANDQHVIRIVDWLLQYAFDERASDIHIEPRREQARIRLRIDGRLQTVYDLPAEVNAAVTSRLKVLARMDVAEKRRPQDGRIKTRTPSNREVELRLSTLPTAFGEKLVVRVFDPDVLLRPFESLGLHSKDLDRWNAMSQRSHGIVLVTGPTGSGKTTTLYTTLKQLATDEVNVSTIEDPIEMVEDAFNQMQVHSAIGLDFAAGVRTLLRQDPDIIMIGEIRDRETADMAIQAALTGHLVLSTLHTNDAASALTRLMEFGVPSYLLASTIEGVMAQRLVRLLCDHCKQPESVDAESWSKLAKPFKISAPTQVFTAGGCKHCRQTGYSGRQGIYEVLEFDREMSAMLSEDDAAKALARHAYTKGTKSLRAAGLLKVAEGRTSLEEVLRVTSSVD
jgi:general secretion pathway protein E